MLPSTGAAAGANGGLLQVAQEAGLVLSVAKAGAGAAVALGGALGIGGAGAASGAAGAAGAAAAAEGGAAAAAGGTGAAGTAATVAAVPVAGIVATAAVVAGLGVLFGMSISSLFADYNPEPMRRLNINNTMGKMAVSGYAPALPPQPIVTNADDQAQVAAAGSWMQQAMQGINAAIDDANLSDLQKRDVYNQIFGTETAAALGTKEIALQQEK